MFRGVNKFLKKSVVFVGMERKCVDRNSSRLENIARKIRLTNWIYENSNFNEK